MAPVIDGDILMVTFRVWFFEIALSGFAYFLSPLIAGLLLGRGW